MSQTNAIGGIVIVIIGILIALWLNNWQEQRVQNIEKQRDISSLKLDVDREVSVEIQSNIQAKLEILPQVLPAIGYAAWGRDAMMPKFFDVARADVCNPVSVTYFALISSSDFKLIHDFDIRRQLEQYWPIMKSPKYNMNDCKISTKSTLLIC